MPGVHLQTDQGYAVGQLVDGEDVEELVHSAHRVRDDILSGEQTPLVHGDITGRARNEQITEQITRLREHRLKRYVVAVKTRVGPRVLKLSEPGSGLRRFTFGGARARREHVSHARAQALGIAATETRGFLVLRRGPLVVRGVQVQTRMAPDLRSLEEHLLSEIRRFGAPAVEPFAEQLANSHALDFFHADLKGFHAFVTDLKSAPSKPSRYRMLWSDFGRVGFRVSSRRRIINLYQAFRFLLPEDAAIQRQFIVRYCEASGWKTNAPEIVLARVHRFLQHKLRTHPTAYTNPWQNSHNV